MFVGKASLENGTNLDLVIVPLAGSELNNRWASDTDLLILCVLQNGRCGTFRPNDHPMRFIDNLKLSKEDADHLVKWLQQNSHLVQQG